MLLVARQQSSLIQLFNSHITSNPRSLNSCLMNSVRYPLMSKYMIDASKTRHYTVNKHINFINTLYLSTYTQTDRQTDTQTDTHTHYTDRHIYPHVCIDRHAYMHTHTRTHTTIFSIYLVSPNVIFLTFH